MTMLIIVLGILAVAALSAGLQLNKLFVIGPQDEGQRLEASATKTANFAGTTKDQGSGFAPGGIGLPMAAVVKPSAADRADSNETYTFVLQESNDDSTYTDCGPAVAIDVAGTAATLSTIMVPGFVSMRYQKLKLTVGGTTPSITYEAWLRPVSDL